MTTPAPDSFPQKLKQLPICRGLTTAEVELFATIAEEIALSKGDVLFEEGAPGDAVYFVLKGHIEVTKKDRGGRPQQLARIGEGSVLGEMSLAGGDAVRSASATALTDVSLVKVRAQLFSRLLAEEQLAAYKIVHNLAQVMSRRLLLMNEKLVDLLDGSRRKEELSEFQAILSHWSF